MKIILSFLLILIFTLKIFSQDTISINEIHVNSTRTEFYSTHFNTKIDSLTRISNNSSLANLLSIISPASIKSYGSLGSLATISLRGAGSEQTSVNWNGFPINSVTTGGADLSAIQSDFFDDIKIIPDANSLLYGSGTSGGAIEMNNFSSNIKSNKSVISYERGSYTHNKISATSSLRYKKLQNKFSLTYINSKNNFKYTDFYKLDKPTEYRKHNSAKLFSVINSLKIKILARNTIEFSTWYFQKYKELPEIAGSYGKSSKFQQDASFKNMLRWNKISTKSRLSIGLAFFNDFLHYTDKINPSDTVYFIDSEIYANKLLGDFSYRYYLSKHFNFETGFVSDYQNANADAYEKTPKEYQISPFLNSKISYKKFYLNMGTRTVFLENKNIKPIFAFSPNFTFYREKFHVSASISNKYRKPTFNEKYWQPGGNPILKPETGYTYNFSFSADVISKDKQFLQFKTTAYHSNIYDMISWVSENGIWTPQNIKNVTSQGLENYLIYEYRNKNMTINYNLSYFYTNAKISSKNDGYKAVNKQVPYTSKHNFKSNISILYKQNIFSVSGSYSDRKYTTQENTLLDQLPANFVANIYIAHKFNFHANFLEISGRISNVFDTQYELIKSYPMPKRLFFINLKLCINH